MLINSLRNSRIAVNKFLKKTKTEYKTMIEITSSLFS